MKRIILYTSQGKIHTNRKTACYQKGRVISCVARAAHSLGRTISNAQADFERKILFILGSGNGHGGILGYNYRIKDKEEQQNAVYNDISGKGRIV